MNQQEDGIIDPIKDKKIKTKYFVTFLIFMGVGAFGFILAIAFNQFYTLYPISIKILRVLALVFIATAPSSRILYYYLVIISVLYNI